MMSLLKNVTRAFLNKFSPIKELYQNNLLFEKNSCYPPGHFYSPIVSVDDIKKRQDSIWPDENVSEIPGINLNTKVQINLVDEFVKYYVELPFKEVKGDERRYFFENEYYSYTDAIFLYSVIRHFSPKKIIEVGSGFSSAVMLDTNEIFFDNKIQLIFIEPYPERLNSLISNKDSLSTTLIEGKIQNVKLETFSKLQSGDILFVDSSHVAKTGSDVNYIFFEILPILQKGVLIHFHDIFYPFEYPKDWVIRGFNWNEDYFLKAFLMYNQQFEIVLFSDYLHKFHKEVFKKMPLCNKNSGGNLWIRKC